MVLVFNTTGSVNATGTPQQGESYARLSPGTSPALASATSGTYRLDIISDSDNNDATFGVKRVWLGTDGAVLRTENGVLTFQDPNATTPGPETWSAVFQVVEGGALVPSTVANQGPTAFKIIDDRGNTVSVPLTWKTRDADGVVATFTATIKDKNNTDITFSGQLLDSDSPNDNRPDHISGTWGTEQFSGTFAMTGTQGQSPDKWQMTTTETLTGRVQVDSTGNPAGLFMPSGPNPNQGGSNSPPTWPSGFTPQPWSVAPGATAAIDLNLKATDANSGDTISYKAVVGKLDTAQPPVFTPVNGLADIPLTLTQSGHLTGSLNVPSQTPTGDYVLRLYADDNTTDSLPGTPLDVPFKVGTDTVVTDPDTTSPTLQSAKVNGSTLVLTFSEAIDSANMPQSGATVTAAGVGVGVITAVVNGTKLTLTLGQAVQAGDVVSVSYTDLTSGNDTKALQDLAGNDMGSVSNFAVTNETVASGTQPTVITISSITRTVDEDLNNNGRIIAFAGEAGPNVVNPNTTAGSNQIKITSDLLNFAGVTLKVAITSGVMNQLQLKVAGGTGVFSVASTANADADGGGYNITYFADATYSGIDVLDGTTVVVKSGSNVTPGTQGTVIGTVDASHRGGHGESLFIHLNASATLPIVQSLAAHIGIGVTEAATMNVTQDWGAAAGNKTVQFSLVGSTNQVLATADRTVSIVSQVDVNDPQTGTTTPDISFNTTGTVTGTAGNGEVYAPLGQATSNTLTSAKTLAYRLDIVADNDTIPGTFGVDRVWLDSVGGAVSTDHGVITFKDTDTSSTKPGPETWSAAFPVVESVELMPDANTDSKPDGFKLKFGGNTVVDVPLTWQTRDATSGAVATFNKQIPGETATTSITFSGKLFDGNSDDQPDSISGKMGEAPFEGVLTAGDATHWQMTRTETLSGRVQVDTTGKPAGLYISGSPDGNSGNSGNSGTGNSGTGNSGTGGGTPKPTTNNTINGTTTAETKTGTDAADLINGDAGNDTLIGGANSDVLVGGAGDDSLDGGAGSADTAKYSGNFATFNITRETVDGADVVTVTDSKSDGEGSDRLSNIEYLWFADKFVGLSPQFNAGQGDAQFAMNSIRGTPFADSIDADALAGASATTYRDFIEVGGGNDTVRAGKGGDQITGGPGDDLIDGGESTLLARLKTSVTDSWSLQNRAQYSGPAARYEILAFIDSDGSKTGAAAGSTYYTVKDKRSGSPDGTDTVVNIDALQFNDKAVQLTTDLWFNKVSEIVNNVKVETVQGVSATGSDYDDVIGLLPSSPPSGTYDFSGSDFLKGDAGNDSLVGGAGGDTLRGDTGNDTLKGGANRAADSTVQWEMNGSNGADVAEFSGAADRYSFVFKDADGKDASSYVATGTVVVSDSKAKGGDGVDTLSGIEVLRFADGEKNLAVITSPMLNWMWDEASKSHKSTVTGMNWHGTDWGDSIDGSAGEVAANIQGGAGNDTIKGGSAADMIDPGEGNDSIDGGANKSSANSMTMGGNSGDSVRYEAPQNRFKITMSETDGKRTFTVTDKLSAEFGGLGTDTLTNVESLQFTDGGKELQVSFGSMGNMNNINGTDYSDRIDADALALAAVGSTSVAIKSGESGTLDITLSAPPPDGQKFVAVVGNSNPGYGGSAATFSPMQVLDKVSGQNVPLTVNLTSSNGHLTGSYMFSNLSGMNLAIRVYAVDAQGKQTGNSLGEFPAVLTTSQDQIMAGAGNDTVLAGAGGDRMVDGQGDDSYDGGANGSSGNSWSDQDVVQFNGAQKRYVIEVLAGDVIRVTDKLPGGDGVNSLVNVEQIQFADGQVNLGVSLNKWVPHNVQNPSPGMDTWVGQNNYDGGILNDRIDASAHDAALPGTPTTDGFHSNRDWINGGGGNDTLTGGAGGDQLQGGKGNDVLDGGANGTGENQWDNLDRASFGNSINRYDIQFFRKVEVGKGVFNDMGLKTDGSKDYVATGYYVAGGFMVVSDRYTDAMGGEGRDVLRNIEQLQFSDASETLAVQNYDSSYTQTNRVVTGKDGQGMDVWGDVSITITNRMVWGTRFGDFIEGKPDAQNNLNGNAGNDFIVGGNLKDDLNGGAGNDTIDGGANPAVDPTRPWDTWNSYDSVRYEANQAQFDIQRLQDDDKGTVTGKANQPYYRVEHLIPANLGGLGTDVLFNVERLQFSGSNGDVQLEVKVEKNSFWNGSVQVDQAMYKGTLFADAITGTAGGDNFMGDAGNDTINAGAGNDMLGAGAGHDSLLGGAGDDQFVNLASGNDVVDGGEGTDLVAYEDVLERYTVKLVREGGAEVVYSKADKFGASYTPAASDRFTVTDRLSAQHGGEGTDTLGQVETIRFNDGTLDLATGVFTARQVDSFEAASTLTVTAGQVVQASAMPVLSVSATVMASDNTDHAIGGSSHDPIIVLNSKSYWAFKALDKGAGTVSLPAGVNVAGYTKDELRFEFGDLELSRLEVVPGLSTETWTDTDVVAATGAGAAYFKLYGKGQLIATGSALEVKALTNTDATNSAAYGKATGSLKVTLEATAADPGFVDALAQAQAGSKTITLSLNSFASEAPPNYNPERAVGNSWNFGVAGKLDTHGFNLLPVWDHWSQAQAPVFVAASTISIELPIQAHDPENQSVSYTGQLGYADASGFVALSSGGAAVLSVSNNQLTGSLVAPTVSDPNLVLRVHAWDDGATHLHGAFIDVPLVILASAPTSKGGKAMLGTDANDTLNGGDAADLINAGAGDDQLSGGAGNDTLKGGEDSASTGINSWSGGDRAMYFGAPRERFEIVRNNDGSLTIIDIASIIDPLFKDGHLEAVSYDTPAEVSSVIGYGIDTLIGIEQIQFSSGALDLAPLDYAYTYRSSWWDGNKQVEYDVTRHNLTGTFMDDLLKGSKYGDQIDGRGGNDTIDGGVEAAGSGNPWEIQDVVRYEGSRERYVIKGVMVRVDESATPTTYTIIDPLFLTGSEVFGIQIRDVLPDANGGSGTDLLVNVERVEFAAGSSGSGDNSITIKPEYSYYEDWSAALVDGVRPKALNARGTDFADALKGTAYNDWLSGNAGNDTLIGGNGGDELEGGSGDDLLLGGANGAADQWGNVRTDTARYNAPFDRFEISATTYQGTAALKISDLLPADDSSSLGTDILVGVETLSFSGLWVDVGVRRSQWNDGMGGTIANAEGTVFGDILTGDRKTDGSAAESPLRDNMRGNDGNDVLMGGGNGDNLNGGEGNDVVDGGANGNTGNTWADQDLVQFGGNSDRYHVQQVSISSTDGLSSIKVDGAEVATLRADTASSLVIASGVSDDVKVVLQNAYANLSLADGQHASGYLVADTLSTDLGGDGTDLVFNVESLQFANGPLDLDIRANANDWDNNQKIDNVWVSGTSGNDSVTMAKLASLTGKAEADVQTSINAHLQAGNDVYLGGTGSDWVSPGAGNDYVDGGLNSGTDQWGNAARDEVHFEAKHSRFHMFDIALHKTGSNWTLSSTQLGLNAASTTLATAPGSLVLADLNSAIGSMISRAGSDVTHIDGWLVADRLPAEFEGSGVDALVNVEVISFSDKWMPLFMQVNYNRDFMNPDKSKQNDILNANVQGTSGNDTIGSNATYGFGGDDWIDGAGGNDVINAGAGGDWLQGGAGDDTIDGGANAASGAEGQGGPRSDTVTYSGNFDRYVISAETDSAGKQWTVVTDTDASGDGVDKMINVESLSFSDRWVRLGTEIHVSTDPMGQVMVNVMGSMMADKIDISGDAYVGKPHFINGNEGNDTLIGGDGPDQFQGGTGDDQIVGGANGKDPWGNPGFDAVNYDGMYGRYTVETIKPNASDASGNSFNDQSFVINGVTYSITADHITADGVVSENLILVRVTDSMSVDDGGSGADLMVGIEQLRFWDQGLALVTSKKVLDVDGDGKPDASSLRGTEGADTLTGTDYNDHMEGGAGADTITGGKGGDILVGGAGNDSLDGGADGVDRFDRILIDVAQYSGNYDDYTVTTASGTTTVTHKSSGSDGTDSLTNIEGLQFADGFIGLSVNKMAQDHNADGVTDFYMIRGIDVLADTLAPATGENADVANASYDIDGAGGNDSLTGGSKDDILTGAEGNDTLDGAAGLDQARYSADYADYTVATTNGTTTVTHKNSGSDGIDTLTNIEQLVFADKIVKLGTAVVTHVDVDTNGDHVDDQRIWSGTDNADTIVGLAALNNIIDSGAGADTLSGGNLADSFSPGAGNDSIDGGANEGLDAIDVARYDGGTHLAVDSTAADYSVKSVQAATLSFSGLVEKGDVFAITLGAHSVSYTAATGNTMTQVVAALETLIEALGGASSPVFRSVSSSVTNGVGSIEVQANSLIFGAQASVTNGVHNATGTFTVDSANQTGSSLKVAATGGTPTVGMHLSYVLTTGSGDSEVKTTYGPYTVTAVSAGAAGKYTLSLDQSMGATPTDTLSLTLTEDNTDTTGAAAASAYQRWFEVSKGSGDSLETDVLKGIEQIVFKDGAVDLNPSVTSQGAWGASGLETVYKISGTDYADLLYSSTASEVFRGGAGADHFVFGDASGQDQIRDFSAGAGGDVITVLLGANDTDGINKSTVDTVAELLARCTDQGGSTMIDLGGGNTLLLANVDVASLVGANFELVTNYY